MKYTFSIFSLVFFSTAFVSIFFGLDIIRINSKRNINRAFLALSIALGIWSFGFAMANSSNSLETALFWRRFSAIGWTTIFSIMLHFLLLLTNGKMDNNFKKYLFLLHIPGIINMYIFGLSNNMAIAQYNLVKIPYGWTNIAVNNGWDYFYYLYYSMYMIFGLGIIWQWKNIINEKTKIKHGNIIFASIIGAAILGSFTDLVSSSILTKPLPQIAPLFILIPTGAMYYSTRYYDLVNQRRTYDEELIISEKDKQKIFYSISIVFIISGLINLGYEYSLFIKNIRTSFNFGFFKSMVFIFTGIIIYLIQNMEKKSLKEPITILMLVVNIPIITINFLEYASITVWAFPIIIIMASLIFSKKTLLISTAIVSIITQFVIWILKPEQVVIVDKMDYIFRIIILVTAFAVGYHINKIYVAKIEENDFQIRFQKLNAKISSDFININKENADEKINDFLSKISILFEADRTYLFTVNYEDNTMTYSHEWCNEGINPEVETIENIPLTTFPWWIEQLENNELVNIQDTREMPREAINEQEQLIRQNVKSLISVPVNGKKRMKGFIGVDSVKTYKIWTEQDIKILNIFSNLLSDALLRIKSEKEIEYMAYYDSLTNLPNRFLFKDRVKKSIHLSKNQGKSINIIFVDLDDFKSVNDTIGHDGGDYLLKEVAESLQKRVRKSDTVARFGGDEFMIMLNNIEKEEDVIKIADNIMDIFSKPFKIYGQDLFITASAGISVFPRDGKDPETLIKNADTAMYEAKFKGKNRYAICTSNMKIEVQKNMTMLNDLNYALEREELFLYYQPQMDLNNKQITGLEALLRWEHPELGMIPPKVFIPIAEKNGLINSIGEWVLRTACLQNKKWQDMGLDKIRIGVNLSAIQFINANISTQVQGILKETGLDPKYLELEITESIAIKETDFVVEVLNKLKKVGVSIAIDDFGTEYSSLSRLKLLPIDRIKIDMEFIHGIENNDKDKAITATIINLARSLELNVLAEGVETAHQSEFLNQKMCDYVQGYYYYKPMPAHEMEEILQKNLIQATKIKTNLVKTKLV